MTLEKSKLNCCEPLQDMVIEGFIDTIRDHEGQNATANLFLKLTSSTLNQFHFSNFLFHKKIHLSQSKGQMQSTHRTQGLHTSNIEPVHKIYNV